MSGSYSAKVGNKGRVVIPAGLRDSHGWTDDTVLVFIEEDADVKVVSLDELERRVHAAFKGSNALEELLAERRENARKENAEFSRDEPAGHVARL